MKMTWKARSVGVASGCAAQGSGFLSCNAGLSGYAISIDNACRAGGWQYVG